MNTEQLNRANEIQKRLELLKMRKKNIDDIELLEKKEMYESLSFNNNLSVKMEFIDINTLIVLTKSKIKNEIMELEKEFNNL